MDSFISLFQQCPAIMDSDTTPPRQCPAELPWKDVGLTVLVTLTCIIAWHHLPASSFWVKSLSLATAGTRKVGKAVMMLLTRLTDGIRTVRIIWFRVAYRSKVAMASILMVNLSALVMICLFWSVLKSRISMTAVLFPAMLKSHVSVTVLLTSNFTVFVYLIGIALRRGLAKTVKTVKTLSRPLSAREAYELRTTSQEREEAAAIVRRFNGDD